MRKKIVKLIESALPQVFDSEGEPIKKKDLANRILDALPAPEVLDLQPFQMYIPFVCSTCFYNENRNIGCSFDLLSKAIHVQHPPPADCPLDNKC